MRPKTWRCSIPILACAAFAVISLLGTEARTQSGASSEPIVVSVERLAGHAVYKVDSQRVGSLLAAFNEIAQREGTAHLVAVLIESTFPISEIWNIDGVAGKAQLTNVRFFVVFRETGMMSEVKRMPAIRVGTHVE